MTTTDTDPSAWVLHALAAELCPVCQHYVARRISVLAIHVVHTADRVGIEPSDLLARYLGSVHIRHLGGGSLSTRPSTPIEKTETGARIRVHRFCNGCGSDLGDANTAELDAAAAGAQLPDVRLECGCYRREERAA